MNKLSSKFEGMRRLKFLNLNAGLKPRVYVRPCTKYPIHGIKACVAKQGDTIELKSLKKSDKFNKKKKTSL
ncbi:hypothetical protein BpHYR1_017212 [Brachionus plicatilis]|uniref:Uncharacterized protein n=1 Tax=Brachionus plicatilis TaxID=10195 RepID=A0A3M7QR63_BRAPC|nr:hypothetical protein BpHYR1_017212 [Brachionus plicatilis]